MEQGKLAEHIRKRAVCPRLFHENPQHERVAGTGRQTAVFSVGASGAMQDDAVSVRVQEDSRAAVSGKGCLVTAQETLLIQEIEDIEILAVSISNRLLSMFARPIGLMAEIILPLCFTEERLRKLVGLLSEKCRELSIDLSAVDTRCENGVSLPVVAAFGVGERACGRDGYREGKINFDDTAGKSPEQYSIIMAGLCGAYGTKLLYREENIRKGFPAAFLKNAEEIFSDLSVAKAAAVMGGRFIRDTAANAEVRTVGNCVYMTAGGATGVFGALWDLSEDLKTGFRVELEKIPLRQETIEFCEKKDVSPYEIDAQGSIIGVTPAPGPVLEALLEEGIPSEVIGYLSAKKEKCLLGVKEAGCEREIRFLDSPR